MHYTFIFNFLNIKERVGMWSIAVNKSMSVMKIERFFCPSKKNSFTSVFISEVETCIFIHSFVPSALTLWEGVSNLSLSPLSLCSSSVLIGMMSYYENELWWALLVCQFFFFFFVIYFVGTKEVSVRSDYNFSLKFMHHRSFFFSPKL